MKIIKETLLTILLILSVFSLTSCLNNSDKATEKEMAYYFDAKEHLYENYIIDSISSESCYKYNELYVFTYEGFIYDSNLDIYTYETVNILYMPKEESDLGEAYCEKCYSGFEFDVNNVLENGKHIEINLDTYNPSKDSNDFLDFFEEIFDEIADLF